MELFGLFPVATALGMSADVATVLPKVVGPEPTQFEVIRKGYSPGRFKLNRIFELPFSGNDADVRAEFRAELTKVEGKIGKL